MKSSTEQKVRKAKNEYVKPSIEIVELRVEERISGTGCKYPNIGDSNCNESSWSPSSA